MKDSRSRWVSKAAAKALVASLVAVAGIGIIAVPEAFAATPTVTSVSPTSGAMNGGTTVTVNGSGFGTTASPSVTAVYFSSCPTTLPPSPCNPAGTSVHVVKGTQLTVVSPAFVGSPTNTTVDIIVYDGANGSTTSSADHYTYVPGKPTVTGVTTVASPPGGPTGGGTVVNVTGTNFSGVTAVDFGSTAGTSILENSLDSLSVTSPAGTGTVDITVTNSAGTSATSSADQFAYNSALAMANGTGAYGTGSSTSTGPAAQPPNSVFNVLSLMTGGPAADPSTLSVVAQPASGTITFNSNLLVYTPEQTDGGSSGAWTYDVTTTGTQTGSISICETASPSTCTTATMTFLQTDSGVYYMGGVVSTFGLMVGVSEDTGNGIALNDPSTAPGATVTVTSAPAQAIIPLTDSGLTVTGVGQYSAMQPVPAGLTLVPGSLKVMGGDSNVSGKYTVSYCTAAMGFVPNECTAQMTGNYKTTYPYIETFLNTGASVPGGSALVLPTIQASFTINSGDAPGTVINDYETEFVASTSITNGTTSATPTLDAYPSTNSCSGLGIGCTPPYQAPTARWSLTVSAPTSTPSVTSVVPDSGPPGGSTPVTIDGSGFTGATAVHFGTNAATSVNVVSDTEISADSPAGSRTVHVTVTTPGGTSATSPADEFTYLVTPVVTGISPTSGPAAGGTPVTITGIGLGSATAVDFGSNAATVTANTATSITATSPAGSGTVDVTVTTASGTSATSPSDRFTYTVVSGPSVTGISPQSGPTAGGTSVTITGTNLASATSVHFGANAATVTADTATSITATSPAGSGTVDVTVTTPGGTSATSSADEFTYALAPTVTMISPASGPSGGGTSVTVTGTNFTGATAVKFGTTAATTFTVNTGTSITATSPAGSGTVDVTVTTPGGTSATSSADKFTYTATSGPAVTSVTPSSGPTAGGTTVTIGGVNLSGETSVKFGATSAAVTLDTATSITATAPAGTGTVDVRVTTAAGTSPVTSSDEYTYAAAPAVTGVSPVTGPASGGTVVTISGTNLAGASAVDFGSNPATVSADTATSITATAPAGTGTVHVIVTTPGGTSAGSASNLYTYVPAPTVSGVVPASGPTAGGTSVTINGTNLGGAMSVDFGGAVAVITSNTSTSITATSPAGSGTVDVTVATLGGTSATSPADLFTYVPAPVVSGVSPSSGPTAVGTVVTVNGSNLAGATNVTFGGIAAAITADSTTSITATAPSGSGTVDVVVTTVGGSSATSAADHYTYVPAPTVTMVSPVTGPASGATTVTITGTNLTGATTVDFGSNPAAITADSATSITATSPVGSGTVDVTVTTVGGTSATSAADLYTYVAAPTVTGVSPTSGPPTGSNPVTITGTGLGGASAVRFGANPATITSDSDSVLTVLAPAGSGIVDVTVTTLGGTSATSSVDRYTYTTPGFHIVTTSLPDATRGVTYSVTLQATGGIQPYKWKKLTKPPKGLKFNRFGVLSGTPKAKDAPGTYQITISVTEHTKPKQSVSTTLTLVLH